MPIQPSHSADFHGADRDYALGLESELAVPLAQYTAKAVGNEVATPHTIIVTRNGETKQLQVIVDKPQTILFP